MILLVRAYRGKRQLVWLGGESVESRGRRLSYEQKYWFGNMEGSKFLLLIMIGVIYHATKLTITQ